MHCTRHGTLSETELGAVCLGRWDQPNHSGVWTKTTNQRVSELKVLTVCSQENSSMSWLQWSDSTLNQPNCRKWREPNMPYIMGCEQFFLCFGTGKLINWAMRHKKTHAEMPRVQDVKIYVDGYTKCFQFLIYITVNTFIQRCKHLAKVCVHFVLSLYWWKLFLFPHVLTYIPQSQLFSFSNFTKPDKKRYWMKWCMTFAEIHTWQMN